METATGQMHKETSAPAYTVILFYNYTHIEDPQAFVNEQRTLCTSLGLKGRILIAHEGMNATLEGLNANIDAYCTTLLADSRFKDTHIKRSAGTADGSAFRRLVVKVRKEVVTLGLPPEEDFKPRETTGKYLSPEELHAWFTKKNPDDFVIVDMRNDYEHQSGHFKGSVLPPLRNFRDLPKVLPSLEHLKNKTVVTVCTGGIRCEKASGYLVKNGFKDVYQLNGGIVTYMEKFENAGVSADVDTATSATTATAAATLTTPANNFLGSLYVFDERTTMAFAPKDKRSVIGVCEFCNAPSEKYTNCGNDDCYLKFIVCENCPRTDKLNKAFCRECRAKKA